LGWPADDLDREVLGIIDKTAIALETGLCGGNEWGLCIRRTPVVGA
jgi:hypothetical protein